MSELKAQNYNLELKNDLRYRSFQFSLCLIDFVKNFPDNRIYIIFKDQLLRSGTSVGANIIEAKASSSRREFVKYYEIALKSANETIYWLNLLKQSKLITNTTIDGLLNEISQICRMLNSSILTMKKKNRY